MQNTAVAAPAATTATVTAKGATAAREAVSTCVGSDTQAILQAIYSHNIRRGKKN